MFSHKSHSKKDLVEVVELFNIIIENYDELNKTELIMAIKQSWDSIGEIVPDYDILLVSNMYLIDNIIFAEIIITANNEKIKVLDKLEFSNEYKIKKITAYKG